MTHHFMQYIRQCLVRLCIPVILLMLIGFSAQAGCNNTSWTGSAVAISVPASIKVSNPQDGPLRTPLSNWFSVSSSIVYCAQGGNLIGIFTTLQQSPGTSSTAGSYSENGTNYTIYNTNIPGIGYVVLSSVVAAGTSFGSIAMTGTSAQTIASGTVYANTTITITSQVRLIKTASLTASSYTMNRTTFAYYAISTNWAGGTGSVYMNGSTLSMQDTTCTVNSQNINVSLPAINTAQLPALSSTTGSTPFSITLNCPSSKNIYMTLTDNSNPLRTSSAIGLEPTGSTASGIGIQVLRNGNPVLLGPDSSMAGNTNQFVIGLNQLGSITIPLSARYIRTGTVQSGKVKAVATFTMSYQ
jgi:type 1 fimbria pilin